MDGGPTGTGIGQPVRRREDLRLLTGRGQYSDDLNLPGQAYAVMLRAPHAHAIIRTVETAAARAAPGVLAVLTADDVQADGLNALPNIANSHPADISIQNRAGSPTSRPLQQAIIGPEVCHVGEIVAAVIADSVAAAKDAAERIAVDYGVLRAVTHSLIAAEPNAPREQTIRRHPLPGCWQIGRFLLKLWIMKSATGWRRRLPGSIGMVSSAP